MSVSEEQLKEMMYEEREFNEELLIDLDEGHGWNEGDDDSVKPYHPDFINHCKWVLLRKHNIADAVFDESEECDYMPVAGRRLVDRFRETGLQIIVKMTSIGLTPQNPEYSTKEWQLAGQANEQICGTAIYCLDSQNISKPILAFRTQTDTEGFDFMSYHSSSTDRDFYIGQCLGYRWLEQIYGTSLFGGDNSCVQSYGNVEMRTGRLLAFPNSL